MSRIAYAWVSIAFVLLPAAAGSLLISFEWVQTYTMFATFIIGAALLVLRPASSPALFGVHGLRASVLAACGAVIVIVGVMSIAGSSVYAIFHAVLFQNASFVRSWYVPIGISNTGLGLAVSSFALALFYSTACRRPGQEYLGRHLLITLKILFFVLGCIVLPSASGVFQSMVPFCWIFIPAPAGARAETRVARALAGTVGAALCLYPFPVASGQLLIGTLLPVALLPVAFIDIQQALRTTRRRFRIPRLQLTNLTLASISGLSLVVTSVSSITNYRASVPLNLPGTDFIRLPAAQAEDLRWVTEQLGQCQASASLPGQASFTLWAKHALLTPLNVNATLNLLSDPQQSIIVDAMARTENLCVLSYPHMAEYLDRGQIAADPPLLHYINSYFVTVAERSGYVVLKRPAKGHEPGKD